MLSPFPADKPVTANMRIPGDDVAAKIQPVLLNLLTNGSAASTHTRGMGGRLPEGSRPFLSVVAHRLEVVLRHVADDVPAESH